MHTEHTRRQDYAQDHARTRCHSAALASTSAAAQIYKCTDPATGKTTYSQTQCATNAALADIHVATPSEEEQHRAHMRAEQAKSEVEAIRRQRELDRIARQQAMIRAQTEREMAGS
ncbi:MAG: DUF4124 domain-containing protein [Chromatiales bacterium]|nr:DUF4124 domain-containing protein [Chromatiales bacterium]